ncbi:LOW QUALITY PROTEIN: growth hormone secretagogue receptor type 1-like [Falco rusticolus]|uniref:LOW QUALITY PROTEIN: growth hormone secretagogue receptor type 1-like n=1 Tax=Falco rusticolus TaxID=120794 RepID=UPI0018867840|nr:LOW QUALITY PROTEIN: growth hormone secretagogue receptor type 1-like [Falco rusticolus]
MALSDTLIFLGLPSDLYRLWKYKPYLFGDFLCKFFTYLSETCTYCTILHITTVSAERYFAVCFPLKAKVTTNKRRVKRVILALWGCSLLTAGPILFLFGVQHPNGSLPQESQERRSIERVIRMGLLETMTWVSTVYLFLPMLCVALLYGLICRKLWRSGQRLLEGRGATQTVRVLAVLVFAFVVCWLPFHLGRILFARSEIVLDDLMQYFSLIAMLLFCLGASIIPILYNKYRKAMSKILHHKRSQCCRHLTRGAEVSSEGPDILLIADL